MNNRGPSSMAGQAAREMGVSISTVERTLAFARAWLFREIQKNRSPQK